MPLCCIIGGGAKRLVRGGSASSFRSFLSLPHDVGQAAFSWPSTPFTPLASHARIFAAHCSLPCLTDLDEMRSPTIMKKLQSSESAGFLNSRVFYT
jgi:hypothetical protein